MSRPNELNKPRTINIIVESDEYEQTLDKVKHYGFSKYIRDLMKNESIIKTTDIINDLRAQVDIQNQKIRDFEDTILNYSKPQKAPEVVPEIKTKSKHEMAKLVVCPKCQVSMVMFSYSKGRNCINCGGWLPNVA